MSPIAAALLAAAVFLLGLAEWPRLRRRTHFERAPRKRHLRVVEPESDPDEFQRAVERDLANLPTFDPRAKRRD